MSTKKTIQINPELFKIAGGKTKKNRDKKELVVNPVISPNNLKNKLLKRIKEHKTKELKPPNANTLSTETKDTSSTYTDEFYGAIDYLSDLSKKQKQQKILHNKTLKTPSLIPQINPHQISLDLPPELAEPSMQPQTPVIFNVNYKAIDDVPYGCLKNGNKKTYREWKELTNPSDFELPSMIRPPTPPKKNLGTSLSGTSLSGTSLSATSLEETNALSREQRLEQIKNKLKKMQDQDAASKTQALEELGKIEKKLNNAVEIDDLPEFDDAMPLGSPDISDILQQQEEKRIRETPKQYLKKTIKRKFTLGKSDKLKRVAVLIKDKQTRKNIINTQRELKKTNITDVRKYLRQHGIIKVGTTCPTDILRKTFESAMLAGEITNTNKETLLHNFLHEDKSN
jgi:hypothetical protein